MQRRLARLLASHQAAAPCSAPRHACPAWMQQPTKLDQRAPAGARLQHDAHAIHACNGPLARRAPLAGASLPVAHAQDHKLCVAPSSAHDHKECQRSPPPACLATYSTHGSMHSPTLKSSNPQLSRCRSHGDIWLSRSRLPWQRQSSHQAKGQRSTGSRYMSSAGGLLTGMSHPLRSNSSSTHAASNELHPHRPMVLQCNHPIAV